MVLKGRFYVGVSLNRLCVPSVFVVDTSHIFPQGVLVTISLVGRVAGVEGTRVCAGCEAELPLWSLAISALSRAGSAPKLLEQKP